MHERKQRRTESPPLRWERADTTSGDTVVLRHATSDDLAAICRIYNEGIADGTSTFETAPREIADIEAWLQSPRHPLWVAVRNDIVRAWARVAPYSARDCYRGIGELSVYVDASCRRQGLGMHLVRHVLDDVRALDYWKVIGKIFVDNDASRALCRRCGFREVGVLLRHGRIGNDWKDVVLLEHLC